MKCNSSKPGTITGEAGCVCVDMCRVMLLCLQTSAETRVRGVEEMCTSVSPTETFDFTAFFNKRTRTISSASSALSGNIEDDINSEYSGR